MLDLERLMELSEKATPPPWTTEPSGETIYGFSCDVAIAATSGRQKIYAQPKGGTYPYADQQLIAAARNALPDLILLATFAVNDTAILAAKLERVERENHCLSRDYRDLSHTWDEGLEHVRALEQDRDALAAKLEEAEAREADLRGVCDLALSEIKSLWSAYAATMGTNDLPSKWMNERARKVIEDALKHERPAILDRMERLEQENAELKALLAEAISALGECGRHDLETLRATLGDYEAWFKKANGIVARQRDILGKDLERLEKENLDLRDRLRKEEGALREVKGAICYGSPLDSLNVIRDIVEQALEVAGNDD